MSAQLRTAFTHVGTALGAVATTTLWLSTHKVDIYALIDQLNTVVTETSRFVTLMIPIATAAYGIFKASSSNKLIDVANDKTMTPAVQAQAAALATEVKTGN